MDSGPEGFAVLAAMLRQLASDDDRRIDRALQALADGLSVEATLTLREAGRSRTSAVIATSALTLVPAQARSANALLDLPLRQGGRLAAALCVVAAEQLDSEDLLLLGAAADVLTLILASVLPAIDARRQVLEIEAERSEVEKTLVARSLAGDLAVSLRAAVAASRRTGAEVRLDLPSRQLPCSPVEAVTAYHVVLAALEGVRTQARVQVDAPLSPTPEGFLTVTVSGALEPHDTGTLARWARRAAALDGRLDRHLDGVTLVLPWSSARPKPDGSADEPARDRTESLVAR